MTGCICQIDRYINNRSLRYSQNCGQQCSKASLLARQLCGPAGGNWYQLLLSIVTLEQTKPDDAPAKLWHRVYSCGGGGAWRTERCTLMLAASMLLRMMSSAFVVFFFVFFNICVVVAVDASAGSRHDADSTSRLTDAVDDAARRASEQRPDAGGCTARSCTARSERSSRPRRDRS